MSRGAGAETNVVSGKRVLVSSNCQAGPTAAALAAFLPRFEVSYATQPVGTEADDLIHEFAQQLAQVDIWVHYVDAHTLRSHPLIEPLCADRALIPIPHIIFDGFHPDCFYVRRRSTGELIKQHLNSAIAVWAFKNKVSVRLAARLFTRSVFRDLGYFDRWDVSVDRLKSLFEACGLDFRGFFFRAKRLGAFMHTINHPAAPVFTLFARSICERIGAPRATLGQTVVLTDYLADFQQWPVYSEIADYLGCMGGYTWTEKGARYDLPDFLERSFGVYQSEDPDGTDLEIVAPSEFSEMIDRVLRENLGVNND